MPRRFNTHPIPLERLLKEIDDGELGLPEFQRSFVWPAPASAELLVSLMQDYPAGSLLLWDAEKAEMRIRSFEGAPDLNGSVPRLALDGQQRLTSLYQAFYGKGEFQYFIKLRTLTGDTVDLDEAILVRTHDQVRKMHLDDGSIQHREDIFPIVRLKAGYEAYLQWCNHRRYEIASPTTQMLSDDQLFDIGRRWIRSLADYEFAVVELSADTDIEAVCRIFEKVNSTGQPLTLFELLTARFWVKGINLRDLWNRALDFRNLKEFEIDPTYILQIIAYRSGISNPGRPGAIFALSGEQVRDYWNDAVRGMEWAIDLLKSDFGVVDKQWLPYAPMLMPLAAIQAERKLNAGPETDERLRKLHQWFWCSIFGGSYEQGAAARAARDYSDLKAWLASDDDSSAPEGVRTWTGFDSERLKVFYRKGQATYKACIAIMLRRQPRDLFTGEPLWHPNRSAKNMRRMYLFPKTLLGPEVPNELKDSVLNLIMLKSSRPVGSTTEMPREYLLTSRSAHGAETARILEESLVPASGSAGIWVDNFHQMIRERQERFTAEIHALTGPPSSDLASMS